MHENDNKDEFQKLIDEIKKNRTELKNYIEASEVRILLKIEELNVKVKILEKENEGLKNKVEYLERSLKKNSILIYGLDIEENYTINHICGKLSKLLEISISPQDINCFSSLNIPKHPIKLDLISNSKKKEIFKNCKKLKGTNVGISNDLTYNQRQDYKILREHLTIARQNKDKKSFIKNNKLYIEDEEYTVDSLRKLKYTKKATSEPSTPTQSHFQDVTRFTEHNQEAPKEDDNNQTPKTKNSNNKKISVKPQHLVKKNQTNAVRDRLRSQNKP